MDPVKFKTKRECEVVSGRWYTFYSGTLATKAKDLQIDHVLPLKEAHEASRGKWPRSRRKEFANDPLNLVVATAKENNRKSDSAICADYLPGCYEPAENRCAALWIRVKVRYAYGLTAPIDNWWLRHWDCSRGHAVALGPR